MTKQDNIVELQLPATLADALEAHAAEEGLTVNDYLTKILQEGPEE